MHIHMRERDTDRGMSEGMGVQGFLIPKHCSDTQVTLNSNPHTNFWKIRKKNSRVKKSMGKSIEKNVKDLEICLELSDAQCYFVSKCSRAYTSGWVAQWESSPKSWQF